MRLIKTGQNRDWYDGYGAGMVDAFMTIQKEFPQIIELLTEINDDKKKEFDERLKAEMEIGAEGRDK